MKYQSTEQLHRALSNVLSDDQAERDAAHVVLTTVVEAYLQARGAARGYACFRGESFRIAGAHILEILADPR